LVGGSTPSGPTKTSSTEFEFEVLPYASFWSGFRMRARMPAKRLKFNSLRAHQVTAT
jgi:hypothetical protein